MEILEDTKKECLFTEKDIPKGFYCYTWIEYPCKKNNYKGKTKTCPFYSSREIAGVEVPWCDYLGCGGTDGENWKNGEYDKLLEYFGSDEAMDEVLGLFMLFDMCKECGINYGEEEEEQYIDI